MNCKRLTLLIFLSLGCLFSAALGFDSVLDTNLDDRRWVFGGNHSYLNSTKEEEFHDVKRRLLQSSSPDALGAGPGEFERDGIWLIKHDPNGTNKWNMTYSLTHLLFRQGWVTFLAHPDVPVVVKSGDKEISRFWSDGTGWCDAIFQLGLKNTFTAEVSTPKAGEYALIDKVVLGIMGNITTLKGRKIDRPCSTRPTAQSSVQAEKEEVANESVLTNVVKRPTLATSTTTTTTSTSSTSQAPVGTPKPTSSPRPSTRTFQTERGGAKCDCVCNCSSKTGQNATFSTTKSPDKVL